MNRTNLIIASGLLILTARAAAQQPQAERRVDWRATGANTGLSWPDAYPDLQSAIAEAMVDPDITQIWIADGTYKPTTTADRTISFELERNNLRIAGGFSGWSGPTGEWGENETEFNDRDFRLNPVILSGDIGIPNDDSDNSYHVVTALDVLESAMLDGVTITLGRATDNPDLPPHVAFSDVGGGLLIRSGGDVARPTIMRCRFEDNEALSFGGGAAIYSLEQENAHFYDCEFINNRTTGASGIGGGGGGVAVIGSTQEQAPSPVFFSCLFAHNTAAEGGGLFGTETSAPEVTNCTFSRNLATDGLGGGIRHTNAIGQQGPEKSESVNIQNTILWGNRRGIITDEFAQLHGAATLWNSSLQGLGQGSAYEPWADIPDSGAFDPLFVDPDSDFHPGADSDVINRGDDNFVLGFPDTAELDFAQDGDEIGGLIPDLDGEDRRVGDGPSAFGNCKPDIGTYEFRDPCACYADINGDETVDVNDLLLLIGAWGACASCAEDIDPPGGCGNDSIDVNDLLLMIGSWGDCPDQNCQTIHSEPPRSLEDCWNQCAQQYPDTNSQEFADCYGACITALEKGS